MICGKSNRKELRAFIGMSRRGVCYQVKGSSFSIEVEFETVNTNGRMLNVFVYVSNKERMRAE